MSETYKEEGIRSLRDLDNAGLKRLWRRVLGKIFNDTEIKGWCKEFEPKNAAAHMPEIVMVKQGGCSDSSLQSFRAR